MKNYKRILIYVISVIFITGISSYISYNIGYKNGINFVLKEDIDSKLNMLKTQVNLLTYFKYIKNDK